MRYRDRTAACLSSQVGCALACVFCATGQLGLTRNLSPGEIVAQAVHVARMSTAHPTSTAPLRNVVLMGMGEPLQNYDAVLQALDILCDPGGLAIGYKQVTVSTVGVVPGIYRLADERRPYSLAVSLHAATQDERMAMLPVARAWPLGELIDACRYYTSRLRRKIFFEWTLIDGVNDSPQKAQALARLLAGIPAQVNLIPLNPTPGYVPGAPRPATVVAFQAVLQAAGIPSTVRQRRGIDIAAGCGQLAGA
jgi:23S rRNA (adenine2503-C2)-methyltransferase